MTGGQHALHRLRQEDQAGGAWPLWQVLEGWLIVAMIYYHPKMPPHYPTMAGYTVWSSSDDGQTWNVEATYTSMVNARIKVRKLAEEQPGLVTVVTMGGMTSDRSNHRRND